MKSSITKKIAVVGSFALFLLLGCDITETPQSEYSPDTFYTSDFAVLTSMSGVYRAFATLPNLGGPYRVLELSTDQVVVHAKIQGWWDAPNFHQLAEHTWDADHPWVNGIWNSMFGTVGRANALISSLENSGLDGMEAPISELRALRAYAYFYLIDVFGNVPVFTEAKVDPRNLPEQNTRTEVFDFIISELEAAAEVLPSQTTVGSEYYGRLTQEAIYSLLASAYLNAGVWTGNEQYDKTIQYTNLVINSGAFSLLPNYHDNFTYNNSGNDEIIFPAVFTPNETGGPGHTFIQKVFFGINGGLFGLPYTPQNGFGTRPSVVELYEDQDVRKDMFFTPGPLIDPRNGETVMVERIVPDGNSNMYNPATSSEGPVIFEIIPATGIRNQPMNAGTKWMKWGLDPTANGPNAGNDIAFFRYADILLMKAEALHRTGGSGALDLVNQVRARSNATQLVSLTLNDVLDERGRELAFEMQRRRDLIRFDRFNDPWEWKEASAEYRNLFPIPQNALDANPNLMQNPGY